MRIKGTTAFAPIKLADDNSVPSRVQVLRVGSFSHPRYGDFQITSQTLAEMKSNFDKKVRGIDCAFDYYHKSDEEASGWVKELYLEEDGTELWAEVDWTPKAQRMLAEREVRYFSPDFSFQWTDPEKKTVYKNVLFGGGLTNRPFVKEMKAIVADETKGEENMTELEKAQKQIADLQKSLKLSEDKSADMEKKMADMVPKAEAGGGDKVAELEKQIAALQAELAKAKGEQEAALAEKKKLEEQVKCSEEAKKKAEKEAEFTKLLSEGKACAAQKDAFLKGDMTEFIKLAEPVNLGGTGHVNTPVGDNDAAAIIKLAEEKQKANPSLSRGDAISIAKKELKK